MVMLSRSGWPSSRRVRHARDAGMAFETGEDLQIAAAPMKRSAVRER